MSANNNLPVGLAEMVPGPELVAALSVVDVSDLSAHELVIVAAAWERQSAFVAAQQAEVLAALAGAAEYAECTFPENADATHQHDPVQPAADEASLAMRWSPGHARGRVRVAVELVTICTATLDALRAGLIDSYKAKLICDRTRVLEDAEARRWVEARVLHTAATKTSRQLDERLRAAVIAADPAAAEERRANASAQRCVSRPEPADVGGADGMARMNLEGPAEDLLALFTAVDAAARHARANGDTRTLDQLRFDVLAGLGWTGLDLGHLGCCNSACQPNGASSHPFGHAHGRAATVHVTVPHTVFHTTRTATSDASANIADGPTAPYLHGFGPVTASAVRRVATEGALRRLLTDDADGRLLEYGRSTYTPPQELADYVIARDVTCRFPTCHAPARHGDIDHKHPWDNGGTTGASNTWALHDGHHLGKTHHGFRIYADTAGTTWWITPAGHGYRVDPETVGPIVRPPPC